jgi:hypothetical protein
MSRKIVEYNPRPATPRPQTLRRTLTLDLAKSLAFFRLHHAQKADRWAAKLVEDLRKAQILRSGRQ